MEAESISSGSFFDIFLFFRDHIGKIITLFVFLTLFASAIMTSIHEHNALPFVSKLGSTLASADTVAGDQFDQIINNPETFKPIEELKANPSTDGFPEKVANFFSPILKPIRWLWKNLVIFWSLFSSLWIIYIMIYVFYKGFEAIENTSFWKNAGFAILTIVLLQIYFNLTRFFGKELTIGFKSILFSIGFLLTILFIFMIYKLQAYVVAWIIVALVIISTIIGIILVNTTTSEKLKSFGDSIIPFRGTTKIIIGSYKLLANKYVDQSPTNLPILPNSSLATT